MPEQASDVLIQASNREILEYETRALHGESMGLPLRNKQRGLSRGARSDRARREGMATSYEEAQGWRAEDVSEKDHGSSGLRSVLIGEDGTIVDVRYIEVKARSRSGAIRITSNERKQARRCGEDCWLYVVTQAGTEKPELAAQIPSPGAHFEGGHLRRWIQGAGG